MKIAGVWSGHEIELDNGTNSDVSIVFIERSGKPLAKKVIQRLDGIWFSPAEFKSKNTFIKNLYENADGVIWQSDFDRQMVTKWWGLPKNGVVIRNGINVSITSKKIHAARIRTATPAIRKNICLLCKLACSKTLTRKY